MDAEKYSTRPFAHLSSQDKAIWSDWLPHLAPLFQSFLYDYHLPCTDVPIPSDAVGNVSRCGGLWDRRVDVVGIRPEGASLIEVKPIANPAALGQLLVYRALWDGDVPLSQDFPLLVVCGSSSPEFAAMLRTAGVTVLSDPTGIPVGLHSTGAPSASFALDAPPLKLPECPITKLPYKPKRNTLADWNAVLAATKGGSRFTAADVVKGKALYRSYGSTYAEARQYLIRNWRILDAGDRLDQIALIKQMRLAMLNLCRLFKFPCDKFPPDDPSEPGGASFGPDSPAAEDTPSWQEKAHLALYGVNGFRWCDEADLQKQVDKLPPPAQFGPSPTIPPVRFPPIRPFPPIRIVPIP